jgi:hypothetical protein
MTAFCAARFGGVVNGQSALTLTAAALILYPFSNNQALCQTNSLIAALIVCSILAARKQGRLASVVAGMSLGMAALMKAWAALLLLPFLVDGWVVWSGAFTMLMASLVVGPSLVANWLRSMLVASNVSYLQTAAPANVSLNGVLLALGVPQPVRVIASAAIWITVVLLVVRRRRQVDRLSALVLASLLAFPYVEIHWLPVVSVVMLAQPRPSHLSRVLTVVWHVLMLLPYAIPLGVVTSCFLLTLPLVSVVWTSLRVSQEGIREN